MRKRTAAGIVALEKTILNLLQNIYGSGKTFTQVSPHIQRASTTEELVAALGEQLAQRERHISRLENSFVLLKKENKKK